MYANWKDVPIPPTMAHLPRDKRGYPIPTMVMRDDQGLPHFQVNDEERRQEVIQKELCSICGKKLFRGRFLVGGPASALHEDGRYIDPPMHRECAEYSLMVCPYLAAPKHMKRLTSEQVHDRVQSKTSGKLISTDPTMIPDRPQLFVLLGVAKLTSISGPIMVSEGVHMVGVKYIAPHSQFIDMTFWRHGQRLTHAEGMQEATIIVRKLCAERGGDLRTWLKK